MRLPFCPAPSMSGCASSRAAATSARSRPGPACCGSGFFTAPAAPPPSKMSTPRVVAAIHAWTGPYSGHAHTRAHLAASLATTATFPTLLSPHAPVFITVLIPTLGSSLQHNTRHAQSSNLTTCRPLNNAVTRERSLAFMTPSNLQHCQPYSCRLIRQ